ncbi:MAG: hypothetical protein GX361_04565 [Bacteroidales bacterium]|nr:hypothetical protein [Bacteroidales bacterium]
MSTKTQTVHITSTGIRKILDKYTPERAISEFIWNGFDANATEVHLDFIIGSVEFDTIESLTISDNGHGICYEELSDHFQKFYESPKLRESSQTNYYIRGKNGYGRLTFFKFARFAEWQTVYQKDKNNYSYNIKISSENLRSFNTTEPEQTEQNVGTKVVFKEIHGLSQNYIEKKVKPFLEAEFAWFLELKDEFKIFVNGVELKYSNLIADLENFEKIIEDKEGNNINFKCKYLRWTKRLNTEFSCFYFLNENLELRSIKTTLFNNKGDGFWHTIVIVNDFFDEFILENYDDNEKTLKLFDDNNDRYIYSELLDKLNAYLKIKRKPFLKIQANKLIKKYEEEDVFPNFSNNSWDKIRKDKLEELVKGVYELEPAIFTNLNKEQKKIFLELLNLLLDNEEKDSLIKIIDAVVNLKKEEREEFAKILDYTRLSYVLNTINLIKDRIQTLENLKQIVFNHELRANERDHLQQFIEKHYWIFGEEYRMVCAEEIKFEEALRKYIYILRGVDEKTIIEHSDKNKEMDLFLAGTDFRDGKPHNLVIEIKNPTRVKKLGHKELGQIKQYIDVILKQDKFNDSNEFWSFYLIGQDYDDIIKNDIRNPDTGLLRDTNNHRLYVKKWSEIINDVERRLRYLLEKLKIERKQLSESSNLDEIIDEISNNSAVL